MFVLSRLSITLEKDEVPPPMAPEWAISFINLLASRHSVNEGTFNALIFLNFSFCNYFAKCFKFSVPYESAACLA